jgi:hypothetical protein
MKKAGQNLVSVPSRPFLNLFWMRRIFPYFSIFLYSETGEYVQNSKFIALTFVTNGLGRQYSAYSRTHPSLEENPQILYKTLDSL